jgi:hypothetical protein
MAERAIDPGGAQDHVLAQRSPHRLLAGGLGAPVNAERRDRIVFQVGRLLAAVEYVVGGNVHQRNGGRRAGAGKHAGADLVSLPRGLDLALGLIDLGVGCGIDRQ